MKHKPKNNFNTQGDNICVSTLIYPTLPCLSTLAESTPENYPMKNWSLKSPPGKERLDFLSLRQYYKIKFTSGNIPNYC